MRRFVALVVVGLVVGGCGGGDDSGDTTAPPDQTNTSDATGTTVGEEPSGQASGSGAAGDGSIQYEITGGYEASGEELLTPAMTFYDGGIWTLTFGGGSTLILVGLDPSTPSVNFTDGTYSVAGSSSECDFQVDHQDESGAAGSFDCSNVPGTGPTGLIDGIDFSGTFEASP